jgi:hypothetical protein
LAAIENRVSKGNDSADPAVRRAEDSARSELLGALNQLPAGMAAARIQGVLTQAVRRAGDSLSQNEGIRAQANELQAIAKQIGDRAAAESVRQTSAKQIMLRLLAKYLSDPQLMSDPYFSQLATAVPGDVREKVRTGKLPEADRLALNRQLVIRGLGDGAILDPAAQAVWAPSALRNLALTQLRSGKTKEAIETLKINHPAMMSIHRAEHDAWIRTIERFPKASW